MGWTAGGSKLEGDLQDLRRALEDYYGVLNAVKMGAATEIPEPPEALVRYRQCQITGLPLVAGGLMDQPHIWLMEMSIVIEVTQLFERLAAQEAAQEQANASKHK